MKSVSRTLVAIAALSVAALAFGFVLFAISVIRDRPDTVQTADGIVVLTGGETRIQAGAQLLAEGRGKRLLISGVNRRVSREDVKHIANEFYADIE